MTDLITTGVAGLDHVLRGGLPRGNLHLVQGPPGAGKTTLALQFLQEGVRAGERTLYVTLSQTTAELHKIARSHGWTMDGIDVVELHSQADIAHDEQTIFQTSDLRLDRTRAAIEDAVAAIAPQRIVYDSLLEVRLLTADFPRYQRELIGLRAYLSQRGITALLLDTEPAGEPVHDTQSRGVVHGVLTLDKALPEFGRAKRRIEVSKMRGVPIFDGWHDMDIREGTGVVVFPRVVASAPGGRAGADRQSGSLIRSGLDRLDGLLGGGMEPGTTTMVVGQAGTGKSTIASLYATAALERGEAVSLFLFEERLETFFRRSEGLGMNLRRYHEAGSLTIHEFNPGEFSAGEFCQIVQAEATKPDLRVIVIDSFTGFMASLSNEQQALFDIQALLKFLARQNILTILIVAQHGLLGHGHDIRLDLSFLGDTVLLLRMSEDVHGLRRSIVAVKKRHGPHALATYDFVIESNHVDVGDPQPAEGDD